LNELTKTDLHIDGVDLIDEHEAIQEEAKDDNSN